MEETVQELRPKYNSLEKINIILALLHYLEQDGLWEVKEIIVTTPEMLHKKMAIRKKGDTITFQPDERTEGAEDTEMGNK